MSAAKKLATTIEKALYNPDWFAESILNRELDEWQSELLNAIADLDRARAGIPTLYNHELKNRFSIRSCHGSGKSSTAATIMHWYQFTRRGIVPCTAPKLNQVSTRLFREFGLIGEKAIHGYSSIYKKTAKKITWFKRDDYIALAESGQAPENIAGFHDDNLLFIVDEASGVNENLYPAVEGALTTDGAIMVMIGNPTKNTGEFHASHMVSSTSDLYYKMKVSYQDSPRVSQSWADGMAKKYGRKSAVFKVRCLAEFPDQAENQLLLLEWLERARTNEPPYKDQPYKLRVSIDVADGGEDSTVITVAYVYEDFTLLVKQKKFDFPSSKAPIMAAETAETIFLAYGGTKTEGDLVVDGLGVGAGTAGALIKNGYNVVVHKGGESATNSDYRNKRAQVYFELRDALRDEKVFFTEDFVDDPAEWDDIDGQLCSIQTKPGGEKVEELRSKDEMKRDGIKSPDRGDSIAMVYSPGESAIKAW